MKSVWSLVMAGDLQCLARSQGPFDRWTIQSDQEFIHYISSIYQNKIHH